MTVRLATLCVSSFFHLTTHASNANQFYIQTAFWPKRGEIRNVFVGWKNALKDMDLAAHFTRFFCYFAVDHRVVLSVQRLRGRTSNAECNNGPWAELWLSEDDVYKVVFCLSDEPPSSSSKGSEEFVSSGNKVLVRFRSNDGMFPSKAFGARFKTESIQFEHQSNGISLTNRNGLEVMSNVNFPLSCPANLKQKSTITAPSGYNIRISLPVESTVQECNTDFVEVKKEPLKCNQLPPEVF